MILMTDSTGCTFIYNEDATMRLARSQSLRRNVLDIDDALEILNDNNRGEVFQHDAEYIEGITNGQSV